MYARRFTCLTSCKDNTMNGQNGQAVMQRKRGNLCMMREMCRKSGNDLT